MRLKRIKLAGFKSFVDPTSIPFPDDMTAIVGPNGCGKSNVIDAVRWVLGESSAKNLRGDAMTDVIFNGSSARKPVSQCSVELVFDNSSGRIQGEYANYNELSVKRLVTRDGQSTYFLNNTKCRRRDVTDLFLGTGLGPRSYAIIEQGMISRLIESKPQELRVFIEEAAGISKYKERRRETENRIRHTRENLERLDDVRAELGQQLEKLHRQASAAKRYKTLKASERELKSQLAAIRWLKHNHHLSELQQDIVKQEADIEAFVAQQRGDERGIIERKEKQQDLKQALDNAQQAFFKVGTDITRLEQNQIHAKQRQQQIDQDIRSLQHSIEEQELHEADDHEKREVLAEQIAAIEPEIEIKQGMLEDGQARLAEAEHAVQQIERKQREYDSALQTAKHKVQSLHSNIQMNMDLQLRTQQRVNEIAADLAQCSDIEKHQQIAQAEEKLAELKAYFHQCTEHYQGARAAFDRAKIAQSEKQKHAFTLSGERQSLQAKIEGLKNVLASQTQSSDFIEKLQHYTTASSLPLENFTSLLMTLNVHPEWENTVEQLCRFWRDSWVSDALNMQCLEQIPSDMSGGAVFLSQYWTKDKRSGSLAEKVDNITVPEWLNSILLVDTMTQAKTLLATLAPHESIVVNHRVVLGKDWIRFLGDEENGVLTYRRQLEALEIASHDAERKEQQVKSELAAAEQALKQASEEEHAKREAESQAQIDWLQAKNRLQALIQEHEQVNQRKNKLEQALREQQALLDNEQCEAELLSSQVEEQEMALAALEEQQLTFEDEKTVAQDLVRQLRVQVEGLTQSLHTAKLTLETSRSQYTSLRDGHLRLQRQLIQMRERVNGLKEEQAQLCLPLEEQAEQLETLLLERVALEEKKMQLANALSEVEAWLSDAEKDRAGIEDKIQVKRQALETKKLESEGYSVRANAVIEQLADMNITLKSVLDTLPDDADEQVWQQNLERTTSSITRLGAVNLAAVEEYDVQSQRKRHLDEQNNDLTSALDTLEHAIRKIDKETRTRFKETFERVNEDLKMLFPKVFGGGSAYLDLTDDDLLETGVSIMARPPGKKNSTIHLLSGGEKALTALSLVFAIFRLNPAPFCLLDEVDAPLDDANVGRFCTLVSEMSKSVQFIYITHNKIAMEMATHLTGVTMAEPGVSRMVAVDVDEAVSFAQA
ncbi:chromosome segregation protein SMC [Aestuariibacter sp. AA17]|uniref:Chromosome partition protein Smc n=1 Tax=Fluctibacter corallii TaxID=2984329 RepID=A0ABT3A5E6_9ALTE|nr:chromosome segregation protein SMC [Aestuariibacter sp. AA17]MCV2883902.1 chromosome segregation protein SMC [Aestuariibacter sp. AA17]